MNVLIKNFEKDGDCLMLFMDDYLCRVGLTTIIAALLACGRYFDDIYELTDEEAKACDCKRLFADEDFVAAIKEAAKDCDRDLLSETKKRIGFTQRRKEFKEKTFSKNTASTRTTQK